MKKLLAIGIFAFIGLLGYGQSYIAFSVLESTIKDDYEVYIMDISNGKQRNLSNHPGVDWAYLAVENKIYFLSDRDTCHRCFFLYEIESSGKGLRKVADIQLRDSWMGSRKNGQELVVKPADYVYTGFYIIDLKGNCVEKISIDLAYINDPAFSPDGKQIVFRGAHHASPRETGFSDELFIWDLEQKKIKQLTYHPDSKKNIPWSGYRAGAPRWKKDGKISFASKIGDKYNIYTINPDGSDQKRVSPIEMNQVYHDWNDKGDIIFEATENNLNGYELYQMNTSGTLIQLTKDNKEQYAPLFVE